MSNSAAILAESAKARRRYHERIDVGARPSWRLVLCSERLLSTVLYKNTLDQSQPIRHQHIDTLGVEASSLEPLGPDRIVS
jgi:hypothetical protein